ncbi:MAG: ACP S-malonyltransferase, partial [Fimbriimonadaceae bacterium]|nr:ACP S-malonyltransferase [Fimbriimonadaceae bacterium]
RTGAIPVISNVTATTENDWSNLLVQQLQNPVRWTESMRFGVSRGVSTLVECGQGEVLGGLMRRIDPSVQSLRVMDTATLEETVRALEAVNE